MKCQAGRSVSRRLGANCACQEAECRADYYSVLLENENKDAPAHIPAHLTASDPIQIHGGLMTEGNLPVSPISANHERLRPIR
jgi:hypothetical protein